MQRPKFLASPPGNGCPHAPHTVYIPATHAVYCAECARRFARTNSDGAPPAQLGALRKETSTRRAQLCDLRNAVEVQLQNLPIDPRAEYVAQGQRVRRDVDEFLLNLVRSIDRTQHRLHSEIDLEITRRLDNEARLRDHIRTMDALLGQTHPWREGDVDPTISPSISSASDAVFQHQLLGHHWHNLSSSVEASLDAVSTPFELHFRKKLCAMDLEALSVKQGRRADPSSSVRPTGPIHRRITTPASIQSAFTM